MIKFKIFFGALPSAMSPNAITADVDANVWMIEHPNIKILDMQYQQGKYGDHSICIMYEE